MGIVKRNIDQLDKLLHQPWADKYCQNFEDKTKIKRTWVALALIAIASCGLLVGFAAQIICNFIGFLYPAYESIKAIESNSKSDDTKWLTYWVVYSSFIVVEFFSDYLLFWIPFYFVLKCALLMYCMHPQYNGSQTIYTYCIRPFFLEHQAKIDEALSKTKELGNSLADQVVDEAKDIGGDIKDSDLAKLATEKATEHVMGEVLANSKQD
jgi:receptor expression-enhancing protein 5/6